MKYDLITVLDVVSAVAGDAHPLVVYPAQFTHREVFQSTSVPRATSTVTIRFATSLPLGENQSLALTIPASSIQNVWTQLSGTYPLHGPDASFKMFRADSTAAQGTACWSQGRPDAGISGIKLMLYVIKDTIPGHVYEV